MGNGSDSNGIDYRYTGDWAGTDQADFSANRDTGRSSP